MPSVGIRIAGFNDIAAEDAIAAAAGIVGHRDGIAIMAVGRLGSRELDVHSDADLLFVGGRGKKMVGC